MTHGLDPSFWRDARRWLPGVLISVVALFVVVPIGELGGSAAAWGIRRPTCSYRDCVLTLSVLW